MRIEAEPTALELAASDVQRQVNHLEPQMQKAYAIGSSRREGVGSDVAGTTQNKEYDVDDTNVMTKEQWASFEPPPYPCLWNVQISRADKGKTRVWRTVTVKGSAEDTFHFSGCSTQGEEAFVCQHSEGAQGGVRLMRNARGEVIGFGSCCKANMVDAVMAARMGVCEVVPSNAPLKSNATAWFHSATGALATTLPLQTTNVMLKLVLLFGTCLLVAISSAMYTRYKR